MSRQSLARIVGVLVALGLAVFLVLYMWNSFVAYRLVGRNTVARGGAEAWDTVTALRYSGKMDVGQDLLVPFVLEQKQPNKMRFEFEFDGNQTIQATDGTIGWKVQPFKGSMQQTPMTQSELHEAIDSGGPFGLLYRYFSRGHRVRYKGRDTVRGRETYKLKVTLPEGTVRVVYLDAETALEVKVDAIRPVVGRKRKVETFFHDWRAAKGGLLVPYRQETVTEGGAPHFLTVEAVRVNPDIDDARFREP